MKRLKRMLLINWYFFQKEVIEFDTLTFLTGKNATGKSTIIDALQLIMLADTSGTFFNKSANGKSRRTLAGYLRGELTDDGGSGFTYLRNDAFTSYIALEFYDEEKARWFTAGCCFDVYSDNDIPHAFFGYYGRIPANLYIEDGLPYSLEKLRAWLRAEHPESTRAYTQSNKEFREYLYGKLGGLQMKFADLFKKAVPFNPISDIQKFITEFVFGNEQPVDIRAMQQTIESYTQMEQEAGRLQERRDALTEIAALYAEYQRYTGQVMTNQYIADRAACELAAEKCRQLQNELEKLRHKIDDLATRRKDLAELHDKAEQEYIHVHAELLSSGLQRHIEDLEKACRERQAQMEAWQGNYIKRQNALARLAANWRELLRSCAALPFDRAEVLGERTQVSLQTFQEQLAAARRAVDALGGSDLSQTVLETVGEAEGKTRSLAESRVPLAANVEEDHKAAAQAVADLLSEQKILQAGRPRYPDTVNALRQALEGRLQARYGTCSVCIVAEVWDVKDPAWRNAVEGYLNTQRYSFLVSGAQYQAAAAIYNEVKDRLHIHGVAVVDIEAVRRLAPERRPGSLAEEIVTNDPDARLYADFLLGRVMKCQNLAEHNRHNISITRDGMLYQQKAIRRLNPEIWAHPLLGQGARRLRLVQIEEELATCRQKSDCLGAWVMALARIPNREALGASEPEEWQTALDGYAQIPAARQQLQDLREQLAQIDRAPLVALQERERTLKDQRAQLDTQISKLDTEVGSAKNSCQRLEQQDIPRAQADVAKANAVLADKYPPDWQQETGSRRYQQERASHTDLTALRDNFARSALAAQTRADVNRRNLRSARENYNRLYQAGFDPDRENNDDYAAVLQEITENKLPEYLQKIRDAREKAIEQFQNEFIGVLHNNIRNAENAINNLNRALRTPFSEDTYAFKVTPNPEYRRYYDMLTDPMNMENYTLFSQTFRQKYQNEIEELFSALTDTGTADVDRRIEQYTNFRTYLNFDLTVTSPDGLVQRLSRTMDKKSGGETQTPFYIAVLASFAQLYRMDRDPHGSTIRLIVFDEAFSKMDGDRIAQSIKILRDFHFQVLLSAPTDKIGDIATLVDRDLIVLRKGQTAMIHAFDPREDSYGDD